MKITRPGVYRITAAEYHADPVEVTSVSSGLIRCLLSRTPAHAKQIHPRLSDCYEPVHKQSFDLGTATHAMVLRDREHFVIIEGDDWRGKRAELRDEAWAAGKTPLLTHQYDETRERAKACMAQLSTHDASDAFDPRRGQSELTLVWQEGGVWCRCRPDWLPTVRRDGMVVYDLKTTAVLATPEEWGTRTSRAIGAVTQAAFYRRGVRRVFGLHNVRFRFVVQEIARPWLLEVYEVDPEAMDAEESRILDALELWGRCLRENRWPGYSPHIKPLDNGPRQEWREELADQRRASIDTMMMDAAILAQRPLENA